MQKLLEFDYCSTFVCIWQLVYNHGLIWLKRFVSYLQPNCVISYFFLSIFNAPYMCLKIRCDKTKSKILKFRRHLNVALLLLLAFPHQHVPAEYLCIGHRLTRSHSPTVELSACDRTSCLAS
jgi:hypothetical protein